MKYTNAEVTFREFPDEISLCINISNCRFKCKGCHSPELQQDIGTPLTYKELDKLIESNKGITLVGFMGGDSNPRFITSLASYIYFTYPNLKIGWYSGGTHTPKEGFDEDYFDYIKLGPYIKEFGPLNNPNTNQKMFKYNRSNNGSLKLEDITYKFWRNGEQS